MRPFLLLGLVFVVAPASAALATPDGVIAKDGVEVTILPTVAPASGPETVEVALDVEARTDDAAHRLGFRSLRGVTAVDCRLGANQFLKADAYALPDLAGQVRPRQVSGFWSRPTAGSYMALVTERICSNNDLLAAPGPAMIITAASSDSVQTPAPSVAAPPIAPPTAPVAVAVAPAAPMAQAARLSKPASRAVAQVAASPTAKGAQGVLNALQALIAPPLAGSVEAATVQGVKVYRASVGGFASSQDARAFCSRATGVTKTCWVRLQTAALSTK